MHVCDQVTVMDFKFLTGGRELSLNPQWVLPTPGRSRKTGHLRILFVSTSCAATNRCSTREVLSQECLEVRYAAQRVYKSLRARNLFFLEKC